MKASRKAAASAFATSPSEKLSQGGIPAGRAPRPQFASYGRDQLKRGLGKYARQVMEKQFKEVWCYGSIHRPLLVLCHVDTLPKSKAQILTRIAVEDAKKHWNSVVSAALFLGIKFILLSHHEPLAIIKRHDTNRHPAFQYADTDDIASALQAADLVTIRRCIDDLTAIAQNLADKVSSEPRD